MINRRNQILGALLVFQIIVAAIVLWPRSNAASAAGVPLFKDVHSDQITCLTIQDSNNSVQLVKEDGKWVLADSDSFPANSDAIDELLQKIVDLKTDRLVARTPASHARLKVAADDYERRIDFATDGQQYTLFVGSSAGSQTSHVRAGGQNEVYLASDMATWQIGADASSWVNPVYFQVNQDDVVAITLENANGTFEFEKDENGQWTMAGLAADETFNPNNLTSLITRLTSLNMVKPLGKTEQAAYGLDDPSAVVTVTTVDADGQRQTDTLRIGALDEKTNRYVVASSQSPYYVQVANYSAEAFITRTRDEFLAKPPTSEATPAASATAQP